MSSPANVLDGECRVLSTRCASSWIYCLRSTIILILHHRQYQEFVAHQTILILCFLHATSFYMFSFQNLKRKKENKDILCTCFSYIIVLAVDWWSPFAWIYCYYYMSVRVRPMSDGDAYLAHVHNKCSTHTSVLNGWAHAVLYMFIVILFNGKALFLRQLLLHNTHSLTRLNHMVLRVINSTFIWLSNEHII